MSTAETLPVVLITGASSGIGRACAEHLAARGFKVYGTARKPSPDASPRGVEMVAMDVDDDASVEQCVSRVLRDAGRLDAVVNNAGFGLMGAIEDTAVDEARSQLETNFFGALRVIRAALPSMRARGRGTIVNMSSLGGQFGMPFSGLYSASKFALEGMSEALRLELHPFGVRVVLIEPGDFQSQFTTARRTTRASGAGSAYAKHLAAVMKASEADEKNAPTPEPIARLLERVLRTRTPALRYSVGMFGQRVVLGLKRFLPARLFEWILRQAFQLA